MNIKVSLNLESTLTSLTEKWMRRRMSSGSLPDESMDGIPIYADYGGVESDIWRTGSYFRSPSSTHAQQQLEPSLMRCPNIDDDRQTVQNLPCGGGGAAVGTAATSITSYDQSRSPLVDVASESMFNVSSTARGTGFNDAYSNVLRDNNLRSERPIADALLALKRAVVHQQQSQSSGSAHWSPGCSPFAPAASGHGLPPPPPLHGPSSTQSPPADFAAGTISSYEPVTTQHILIQPSTPYSPGSGAAGSTSFYDGPRSANSTPPPPPTGAATFQFGPHHQASFLSQVHHPHQQQYNIQYHGHPQQQQQQQQHDGLSNSPLDEDPMAAIYSGAFNRASASVGGLQIYRDMSGVDAVPARAFGAGSTFQQHQRHDDEADSGGGSISFPSMSVNLSMCMNVDVGGPHLDHYHFRHPSLSAHGHQPSGAPTGTHHQLGGRGGNFVGHHAADGGSSMSGLPFRGQESSYIPDPWVRYPSAGRQPPPPSPTSVFFRHRGRPLQLQSASASPPDYSMSFQYCGAGSGVAAPGDATGGGGGGSGRSAAGYCLAPNHAFAAAAAAAAAAATSDRGIFALDAGMLTVGERAFHVGNSNSSYGGHLSSHPAAPPPGLFNYGNRLQPHCVGRFNSSGNAASQLHGVGSQSTSPTALPPPPSALRRRVSAGPLAASSSSFRSRDRSADHPHHHHHNVVFGSAAAAAAAAVAARATVASLVGLTAVEKTNVCRVCGKSYARPSTLKTHLRTHSGEKPYVCGTCHKSFSQAANLTAHVRTHSGDKPFRCPVCDRRFSQSSSVTTHLRTHSGERPYRCRLCKKTFSDSSTLTKHLRIHSGEKPYQCKVCLLRFSQSGNRRRHARLHHDGLVSRSV